MVSVRQSGLTTCPSHHNGKYLLNDEIPQFYSIESCSSQYECARLVVEKKIYQAVQMELWKCVRNGES